MRIVSLDPGGTTGYAIYDTDVPGGIYTYGELTGDHQAKLYQLLAESAKYRSSVETVIVCERFEHRNAEFAKLISVEYIGVVIAFSQLTGYNLVMQGASQAKTWATDDKLTQLGMKLPAKMKHARDAMRHLVYYICNNKAAPPELRDEFFFRLKKD